MLCIGLQVGNLLLQLCRLRAWAATTYKPKVASVESPEIRYKHALLGTQAIGNSIVSP
jgi:hypothetical protein